MVKNPAANAGDIRDMGLIPGLGRFPGMSWQPTLVFLHGEFHGQRSLKGSRIHGVAKNRTRPKQLSTHTCIEKIKYFTGRHKILTRGHSIPDRSTHCYESVNYQSPN